jgi:hypothetical protein
MAADVYPVSMDTHHNAEPEGNEMGSSGVYVGQGKVYPVRSINNERNSFGESESLIVLSDFDPPR